MANLNNWIVMLCRICNEMGTIWRGSTENRGGRAIDRSVACDWSFAGPSARAAMLTR